MSHCTTFEEPCRLPSDRLRLHEDLCKRRLRTILLRKQLRSNSSSRSSQAIGIAIRNESSKLKRLAEAVTSNALPSLECFEAKQDQWDQSVFAELRAMSKEQGVPIYESNTTVSQADARATGADFEQKFLYDSDDLLLALKGVAKAIQQPDDGPASRASPGWCSLSLCLATRTLEELREDLAELHPKYHQVGVDDSDLEFMRQHEALGITLSKQGDAASISRYLRQGCTPALRSRLYKHVLHQSTGLKPHIRNSNRLPRHEQADTGTSKSKTGNHPPRIASAGRVRPIKGSSSRLRPKSAAGPRSQRRNSLPKSASQSNSAVGNASHASEASSGGTRRSFSLTPGLLDGDSQSDDERFQAQIAEGRRRSYPSNQNTASTKLYDSTVVDRLHKLDLELIRNNDNYFVFEDLLRNVLPRLFREHMDWLKVHSRVTSRLEHIRAVPYYGFALKAAPLAYVFRDEDTIVLALREMFARYWCQLNVLRTLPLRPGLTLLPNLCVQFEELLAITCPEVVFHMQQLSIAPLDIAFPWIHLAFSTALSVDELLLLWDRIIGFDSLVVLPVLAAAIFQYRRKALTAASNAEQVRSVLKETAHLNVVALLQAFLFT